MRLPRIRVRPPTLAALALLAGLGAEARAQGIFLCIDANGRKELTDNNKPGCKQLDVPSSIAAPAPRRTTPSGPARQVTSPSDFPKVDSAQQRARDNDRREILNEELRNEERKLVDLRREFNNGVPERQGNEKNYAKYQERVGQMSDSISRAEKNIEALRRELANIK